MFKRVKTLERAFEGAIAGGALAAFALAVGVVRCALVESRGVDVSGPTSSDFELVMLYVAGFIIAGAVVGAASPIRRFRIGALALGLVGAGIVATAIAVAEDGRPRHWEDATWFATVGATLIFGVFLAFHLYERHK